jgi:glycosyltransferase involved in cell wall biosynthesis
MATIKPGILILSPFFSPNIGGTENQLDDLVQELDKNNFPVYIQTYSPLTTTIPWKKYETRGKNIKIWRYSWFGYNLFHKVEKFPLVDFFYLTPYLFFRSFIWMIFNHQRLKTIHAQGMNASLIGVIYKYIFHKKLVTSIHAVYEINPESIVAKLNGFILKFSDKILATSDRSVKELATFGVDLSKVDIFIPWIDLNIFKPYDKIKSRKEIGLENKFTVLFISRLIPQKGARVLAEVAQQLPQINFVFAGLGPDEEYLRSQEKLFPNIKFVGPKKNSDTPKYYCSADIYCFPTQYEEGFGKVLIESLACGTPVVTSNKGAIPKVVDSTVAVLVVPTVNNLKNAILDLYKHPEKLLLLKKNSVQYARKRYGPDNAQLIYRYY